MSALIDATRASRLLARVRWRVACEEALREAQVFGRPSETMIARVELAEDAYNRLTTYESELRKRRDSPARAR